jgi:hypothetical protein
MNAPIKEGREILARVMAALVDAPECYIPVRGPWLPLTEAQTANWDARQTIGRLLREGAIDLTPDVEEETPYVVLSPAEERALFVSPAQSFEQDMEETEKRARIEAKPAQSTLFS